MLSRSVLALGVLASVASAHMQLSWPYPLHSKFNPATPEALKDYSMTSPLLSDGVYPCKGFINSPSGSPAMDPVVTWSAGETVNVSLAGTATHGGGSCQFSLSYDQGASWNVIHSYVGGCMVDSLTMDVPIPSSAPSGEALFAWSWFNHEGNREMYQNCAVVTVQNGGSGLTGPEPFVANAGVNECKTIEGIDVVFPDPGDSVHYGGSYANSKPTTPTGYTGSSCVGPNAGSGSGNATRPAASSSATGTTSASSSAAAATAASSSVVHNAAIATGASASSTATPAPSAATSAPAKSCLRRRSRKRRMQGSKQD